MKLLNLEAAMAWELEPMTDIELARVVDYLARLTEQAVARKPPQEVTHLAVKLVGVHLTVSHLTEAQLTERG